MRDPATWLLLAVGASSRNFGIKLLPNPALHKVATLGAIGEPSRLEWAKWRLWAVLDLKAILYDIRRSAHPLKINAEDQTHLM